MPTQTRITAAELGEQFRNAAGTDTMPHAWTPVGAWVRVSSGSQDEANQVPAVINYCLANHYWPVRWYVVRAKSAFKGEHQTDLNDAVTDMRDGITRILVIWHSDRIERRKGKGTSLLDTLSEFVDAGGKVESVQEPMLGETGFGGEVSTFISGIINNEKSKHISEQVKLSIERTKANGAVYNNAPWGFTLEGEKYGKQIVPTGYCREYAPLIFQMCIDGDSLRTIAAWLDSEHVPTYRGKEKWNESTVRWIIRQRAYAGRYLTRTGELIQTCEAVISPSTFDRANAALKSRPKRGPVSGNRPMLANLKCARCGASMYRIKSGSTVKRYYYRCFGNGAQRRGCGNMVPFELTEFIVASQMFVHSTEPHTVKTWIDGENWDDQISDVKQQIREAVEAERFEDMPALQARLAELRSRESVPGHYDQKETGQTVGAYFWALDNNGRRDYLASRDIRVEKVDGMCPVRVLIDGQEHEVTVRQWNEANRAVSN